MCELPHIPGIISGPNAPILMSLVSWQGSHVDISLAGFRAMSSETRSCNEVWGVFGRDQLVIADAQVFILTSIVHARCMR